MRFQVHAPASTQFPRWPAGVALSPDGGQIAFGAVSNPDQAAQIWLHSLNSSGVRRLAGTDGASHPGWSPDGRSIAFTAFGKLMRYDLQKAIAEHLAHGRGAGRHMEHGRRHPVHARPGSRSVSHLSGRRRAGRADVARRGERRNRPCVAAMAARRPVIHLPGAQPEPATKRRVPRTRWRQRAPARARRRLQGDVRRARRSFVQEGFPPGGAAFSAAGWDAARHAVGRRLRCLFARSRRRARYRRVARRRPRVRQPGPPSQPRADVGRSRRPAARDTRPRRSLRGFCALAGRTVRRASAHGTRARAARSRSVDAGSVAERQVAADQSTRQRRGRGMGAGFAPLRLRAPSRRCVSRQICT